MMNTKKLLVATTLACLFAASSIAVAITPTPGSVSANKTVTISNETLSDCLAKGGKWTAYSVGSHLGSCKIKGPIPAPIGR